MRRGRPGRRGGLGLGELGFEDDGQEGAPFGVRIVAGIGEGGAEEVAVAAGDQRGEAEELAEREGLGGGEPAVELVGDVGDGADAGALQAVEVAVEGGDGGVDAGVGLAARGLDGDHGLFPGGDFDADGVLLDHGGHGLGEVGGVRRKAGMAAYLSWPVNLVRGRGRRRGGGSRR